MPVMHKRKSITSYPDSNKFLNFFFKLNTYVYVHMKLKKC